MAFQAPVPHKALPLKKRAGQPPATAVVHFQINPTNNGPPGLQMHHQRRQFTVRHEGKLSVVSAGVFYLE